MVTRIQVLSNLKEVVDPEIGANLVDLGLIRDVLIDDNRIQVRMVLTIPGCPLARYLISQVENKVQAVAEGRTVDVQLLDEPWDPASMFWRDAGDLER
ncbi:MAG TPA: metal-sulfur cluster assembly factor [Bryobacteraceae bacterium]|nr:metal-sulfur cluster assembly factor [Bryobacteraceae bacterium]